MHSAYDVRHSFVFVPRARPPFFQGKCVFDRSMTVRHVKMYLYGFYEESRVFGCHVILTRTLWQSGHFIS